MAVLKINVGCVIYLIECPRVPFFKWKYEIEKNWEEVKNIMQESFKSMPESLASGKIMAWVTMRINNICGTDYLTYHACWLILYATLLFGIFSLNGNRKLATRSYKRFCLGKERGFEISFHWISCSGLNYQHIRLLRDQICQLLFPVARMASYFLSATCYHPLSIWWSIKVEFPLKLSLLASCLSHLKSNTFE